MIDFAKEVEKYKPLLKAGEVEGAISDDETHDIIDVFEKIVKHINSVKKEEQN